ncbi:MAG: hypothetical protein KDC56_10810 [Flavobacteriaceae bacterium]|nr:hypothetical protein [Flavobacteriaceae bacterium]
MKKYRQILIVFLLIPLFTFAQSKPKDSLKKQEKLARAAFESSYVIDNPTSVVLKKKGLEVMMQHRFGLINGGTNDMAGIWAPSNIRIALEYGIHDRLTIGYGTTKFNRLQDFNWKVAVLRQTESGKVPVNVTYYGNFTIDARKKENFNMIQDRYSFFNQIIISRRFSPNISLQIAPSISHYNLVSEGMENDMVAIAFGGRFKISPQTAILIDYSQPITQYTADDLQPKAGFSVGIEFATSGHEFQLMLSSNNGLVPQKNYIYNQNDFFSGDILLGFNITRKYNF